MSYADDNFYSGSLFAADAEIDQRMAFIRRVYLHVLGAVLGFVAITGAFLSSEQLTMGLLQLIGGNWWLVLIAFMAVNFLAERWARSGASPAIQYAGLALYTTCEAIIFVPLLYIARSVSPDILPSAALITLVIFGGLTGFVLMTKADFSFLRGTLWLLSMGALGLVVASMIFSFHLGIAFSGMMIVLFGGWILYDTSNVLHHYRTDQHVSAALALFSSLATLFWYVIRFLIALQGED